MTTIVEPRLDVGRYEGVASTASVPWYLFAIVTAATFVVVGIVWDIAWHMTIGRDTFWTPAHMCTYAAGAIVGVTCGRVALKTTFAGTPAEHDAAVGFWGFRAPLGAWIAVWGSIAMLTSAPFDDWWHNAYGLDVKIISPPHSLLAVGMISIVIGALVWTLAWQNRTTDPVLRRKLEWLFVYGGGLILAMAAVFVYEYSERGAQHASLFYRVSAMVYPLFLLAIARGSTARWPATTAALVYMAVRILMGWILPLFPAEPKLGPIFHPLDHMATMEFPILLAAPGLAIDLLMHRVGKTGTPARDWALAPAFGLVFVVALLAAQWPFADFLHSPAARNRVFFADRNFGYFTRPTGLYAQYRFFPGDASAAAFLRGLALAVVFATLSSRIGMACGRWMTRVCR